MPDQYPAEIPGGQELFSPFQSPEGAPAHQHPLDQYPVEREVHHAPDTGHGVGHGANHLLQQDPLAAVHNHPLEVYPGEHEAQHALGAAYHSPPGTNHLLKQLEPAKRSVPLDGLPPQYASVERQLPPRSDAGIDLRMSYLSVPGDPVPGNPVSPIPEAKPSSASFGLTDISQVDRLGCGTDPSNSELDGRGAARAKDAQGTPTQRHISPSILVYE